jgi:hypothetical protein
MCMNGLVKPHLEPQVDSTPETAGGGRPCNTGGQPALKANTGSDALWLWGCILILRYDKVASLRPSSYVTYPIGIYLDSAAEANPGTEHQPIPGGRVYFSKIRLRQS